MNYPLVVAVVVHYNGVKDTLECLDSLMDQTYPNLIILLVNNGSIDLNPSLMSDKYSCIEVITLPVNKGATGGYNEGIKAAFNLGAEYIYLVNNDTYSNPDVIEVLVDKNRVFPGVMSPLIYFYSTKNRIWSAGGKICSLTLDMKDDHGRKNKFTRVTERDLLTTCAILLPKYVLDNVGLFDETYFTYYDDADLSFRIRKAGFSLYVVPEVKVYHKESASSGGKDSPMVMYWMGRGSMIFYRKNAVWWQWLFIVPLRFAHIMKSAIYFCWKRKPKALFYYLKGIVNGLFVQLQ